MTGKQVLLKSVYPLLMRITRSLGINNKTVSNKMHTTAPVSFFDLQLQLNNGQQIKLDAYKGKKILLVNTASNCGYTGQYTELQKLYEQYNKTLVVIGFPANDFKEQEKGNDEQIAAFCQKNYGVSFPLALKSSVVKGDAQNDIYQWLTTKEENGWNDQQPVWNFSKYLVSEDGQLTNYFEPGISPLSKEITDAVK